MENLFRPLNIHFTSLKEIVVVLCLSRMTLVLTIFSFTVDRRSCTIADGWNASKIVLWKIYVIKDSCQCSTSTSSWKISFILMDEPSETGKMHIACQRATAIVDEVLVLYEKTFFGWSIVAGPRRIRHLSMLMKTLCIFSYDTSNFRIFHSSLDCCCDGYFVFPIDRKIHFCVSEKVWNLGELIKLLMNVELMIGFGRCCNARASSNRTIHHQTIVIIFQFSH